MRALTRRVVPVALALAALAAGAAPASAQFDRIRRAIQRASSGPSPEVMALLNRIDTTRTLFDRATSLMLKSSYVMESVVATQERRSAIRRELAAVDSLEQRGGENRVQFNAEDRATMIEQATAQRQFEGRQLTRRQQKNIVCAVYNAGLAVLMDREAIQQAQHILGEAQTAMRNIANDPVQLVYFNRLRRAVTEDLPAIVTAGPKQIRLGGAINGAYRQARASGQPVLVTEATARTDPPRPIDINAI